MILAALCLSVAAVSADIRQTGPGGGGFIECVVASRHDAARLLVGCDVGGFYFSSDGGRHYEIRNAGLGDPMVETIAEHPTDSNRLVIGGHGGLYASSDLGLTWRRLTDGLPRPIGSGHALPIKKVEWCEDDPRRLYAATGCPRQSPNGLFGHIYRSDDGGESWRMVVADGAALTAARPVEILDMTANPRNRDDVLVVSSRGVFRSTDGAVTWKTASDGLPGGRKWGRLARCAAHPDRVYLTLRDPSGTKPPRFGSVWRSDDGGTTWRRTADLPAGLGVDDGKEMMNAWGRMRIAADPVCADRVWCGGLWFKPGLCVSEDGGASWRYAVEARHPHGWLDAFWFQSVASLSVSPFDPRIVTFGTSSAIYRTEDGGANWSARYAEDLGDGRCAGTGLDVLCVSEIVPDRHRRDRWLAAFYDVGLLVTEDAGRSWRRCMEGVPRALQGACFSVAQSPTETNRSWAVFGTWGGKTRGVVAESLDDGRTWQARTSAPGWPDARAYNLQVLTREAPYALAVVSQKAGLLLGADGGASWSEVSTNALPDARAVTALAFAEGVLYAGTSGAGNASRGLVWASGDRGRNWRMLLERPAKLDGTVTAIAVRGKRLAASVKCIGEKGGLWFSSDGGVGWRRIYHERPYNDLNAVAFVADGIVVGSRNARWHDDGFGGEGLLFSRDAGATWERLVAPGFDRPEIMHMSADPFDPNRVLIGTWGDSISVLTLP